MSSFCAQEEYVNNMNHHHNTGGIRLLFFIINLLFLTCGTALTDAAASDNQQQPIAEISRLRTQAENLLLKPGAVQSDMDSVRYIAGRIEVLSKPTHYKQGLGLSKLLRAMAFREEGHPDKSRPLAEEAVNILSSTGTELLHADALVELGASYGNSDPDLPPKIALYEKGINIYHNLGDQLKEATLLEVLGDLNLLKQNHADALKHLNHALSLYKTLNYKRLQGIYAIMGSVYNEQSNFVEALRYNLLALKTGEEQRDSSTLMATIYNRLAMSYYSIDYNKQALECYQKGIRISRINNDIPGVQNLLFNIGEVLGKMRRFDEALDSLNAAYTRYPVADIYDEGFFMMRYVTIYLNMKDYRNAEKYYQKMLGIYGQVNEIMKQELRVPMSSYLTKTGHYTEAAHYLDSFAIMERTYPASVSRNALVSLLQYKTDSARGNLSGAIKHMLQHKMLSDSARNLAQSRQLGQIQLQFETEQKDKDIKLLVQKNQLQEADLQKEKVFRYVIIGGVIILIAFLALMYARYRSKKRTNIQLESQQNEINAQNEALKGLLDEKEWLLKEIHHRVKNNLQIIISLLNTQSQYLNNKDALAAIRNSQQRMYSMSLIHQRLYQTDNLGKIDMHWYIPEMIGYMKDSFETEKKISFKVNCDPIALDVIQAVPLGLILNEAVSNAIKYAFPDNRKGRISVILQMIAEDTCELSVSDDGVGIPEGKDPLATASLGMSLMQGLAMQLDGTFELSNNYPGLSIRISFKYQNFATSEKAHAYAD
ncbi:Two-component sensor histidine kinase, contains HisKA and HATPase domains [Chitinophaga sp. YR627]|uniref:tetratricopeptide repeat-containing sensor histidine kinase n=1 Tax=Chitinophaga sp. YR627 TaxID=1881041 RepID=UPI0008E918CA|nr:histidine kinase dimerization/phosphoacceptor domain -containing protein [Chitinophaga sp. YR627]SFM72397.1 Two-component sensor histidine kinase, contains HisKA and HATPase domains [Chitinophaga sp. YR627]